MAPNSEDIKWRKMEGGGDLKTMECLRRRLLAERQASLVAKEEAELMDKRSKELEKQITEEIAMKTKADKKLQLLRKKLESLNLSSSMLNSEPSVSSEILIAASSLPSNEQATGEVPHLEDNPNARVCAGAGSSSSASETCCDEPSKAKIENGGEEFISMGGPLAVVAASLPEKSESSELKPVINARIIEVLNDLKHARERIQGSMEISELNMMKVGPV